MTKTRRAGLALAVVGTLGCDAEVTNDYTEGADPIPMMDAMAPQDGGGGDAGGFCPSEPVADSGPPVNEGEPCDFGRVDLTCPDGPVLDSCLSAPVQGDDTATVTGTVVLNDGVSPGGDHEANGVLYISVLPTFELTSCPGPDAPAPVARTVVHCADFRAGEPIPFTIGGVPLRDEAWKVLPYLDVNPVACRDTPIPDTCDLVGLPADAVVTEPGDVTLDSPLALITAASTLEQTCGFPACE